MLTCNKDISRHKSSLGLMTGSGVDTEVELILARSSIFSFPSNISDMVICPAHCSLLGIGWRRDLACCSIPVQLSKHLRKSRTKDRGINKDISRLILRITGIFIQSALVSVHSNKIQRLQCYITFHKSQVTFRRAMLNTKIESLFNIYNCFIFFSRNM